MQRSLPNRLWQVFLKFNARLFAVAFFKIRCHDRNNVPATGGGLLLSNHQSNLDPILVGLACNRRLNYVARQTLFWFAPFRWLINSVDAIPIDREGTGLGGLKETLKRLKRGEMVVLFPEGTRTPNGEMRPIKPGFVALAKRSCVPLVPVALDGAYDSWPRNRRFPRPAVIHVQFGVPIAPAEVADMTEEQLVLEVERRMRACFEQVRAARLQASGQSVRREPLGA